jgi:hypothetical protein
MSRRTIRLYERCVATARRVDGIADFVLGRDQFNVKPLAEILIALP